MKRRSELYNKSFRDIFTKEVYERLKRKESFRLNLKTMKIEEIPVSPGSDNYYVIFGIKTYCNNDFVIIHDFITMTFLYEWMEKYSYEELLDKIEEEINI